MGRISVVAALAIALAVPSGASLVAPSGAAAQVATAAVPAAKAGPHKYRVAYAKWRKRLVRHHVYVGRNLLASPRGEARAANDAAGANPKRQLRRSIHRMQRRWSRWLRHDPQGLVVAFKLKVRHKVPSWGKAHLRSIAWCESHNDPRAIGGGGAYRGMYQFSFSTWAVVGGSGDPAAASRWEQTWRAWLLLSQHGSGHWPVCG